MATQLPSNLYSGGAVVFNNQPYIAFQANMMARKQAKDEALDEYYRNLNQSVNPAGVRMRDMPDFEKKMNDLRGYWSQNRDAIKNPMKYGAAAQTEYQRKFQDVKNLVAMSKEAEKAKEPFLPILADPDKRSRIPDTFIERLTAYDATPVSDPNFRTLNINELQYNPKPFEIGSFIKKFDHIKPDEDQLLGATDPKTMQRTVTTKKYFGEDAKKSIYGIAASSYLSDPSFKKAVDDTMEDKEAYGRLNEIFKKEFGHDIQTPEDFAAAYSFEVLKPTGLKVDYETDQFAKEKSMEGIRQANAKELINLRKTLDKDDEEMQGVWIDSYIEKIVEDAISSGNKRKYKYKGGKTVSGYKVAIDPVMAKAIGIDDKNKGELVVTEEGDFIPVYYKTDDAYEPIKDGESYAVDSDRTNRISQDQLKLALGKQSVSVNQRTKEMKSKSSKPKKSLNW